MVAALIAMAGWSVSARILIEANFSLFSVGILIGGCDHLANPLWWLTIEFVAEAAVMESFDKGGDDFCFHDVGNRIPHLRKSFDVTTKELEWFLINAIQIVLGAWPSTRSHIVVDEDLLQLFLGSNGV